MSKDFKLEFDTLNHELIPLLDQYKNLQKVYMKAVNNGGCYITIDGPCDGDKIKTDHPYFFHHESENTNKMCKSKQTEWQKTCNNRNVTSIFISKDVSKTLPIKDQLNALNKLIINKFNQMQSISDDIKNTDMKSSDKKAIRDDALKNIKTLLDDKKKFVAVKPANTENSKTILNSSYIKYVFWLCLVILVLSILYFIIFNNQNIIGIIIKLFFIMIGLYYSYTNIQILYIIIFIILILAIFFGL